MEQPAKPKLVTPKTAKVIVNNPGSVTVTGTPAL